MTNLFLGGRHSLELCGNGLGGIGSGDSTEITRSEALIVVLEV